MKYDLDLDQPPAGTSHAIALELVGSGHRVLDVGCSTGYVARLLAASGNVVSGVEVDPEAAAVAAQFLERVVVGDLELLDLTAELEPGNFDVLLFADVLEHVKDPVGVLRRSLALLAPGGSVVISIPNVSHAAVRLALLEGHFDYRPVGLLDETHLRFFTRSSVEDLLRSAGLVATDMRRTVADALATEIPVPIDHFPGEIVDQVRALPDADTYQFVLRAVRASQGTDALLVDELLRRGQEVGALREAIASIVEAGTGVVDGPVVGLVGDASVTASIRSAVVAQEINDRLPALRVEHLVVGSGPAATWTGAPLGRLPAPAEAAGAYDALVLTGSEALPDPGVAEHGLPVHAAGAALGGRPVPLAAGSFTRSGGPAGAADAPDPLLVADRLVPTASLLLRLRYLEAVGRLGASPDGHLTVVVGADSNGPVLGRVVAEVAADASLSVVVTSDPAVDPGHRSAGGVARSVEGSTLLADPTEVDLLALIGTASVVVTDSPDAAALALALRRPLLAVGGDGLDDLVRWTGDTDLVARTPAELLDRRGLAGRRAGDDELSSRLSGQLDLAFDELAAAVTGDVGIRLGRTAGDAISVASQRIRRLEEANQALQGRLRAERDALGDRASFAGALAGGAELKRAEMRADAAERRADAAEAAAAAARAELQAHLQTLSMRVLAPGRRLYGRMRRLP